MTDDAFDVAELFAPLSFADFRSRHFLQGEPFVRRGSLEAFEAIASMPEFADAASLCNALRRGTNLFGPNGFAGRLTDAREAMQFYKQGFTIYANDVETSVPALLPFLESVAYRFGCAEGVIAEAFTSCPGAGATMHYDFDFNFQIQIRGRKRWRIAKNPLLGNPMQSFAVLNEASYSTGLDRLLVDVEAYPREMPADAMEFVAEPGTVVFPPRGVWHETLALEESFGVNFVLKASPWMTAAMRLVLNKLAEDERWRACAFGVLATEEDGTGDLPALATARSLLPSLKAVVDALTPEELLLAPNSQIYSWPRGAKPSVVEDGTTSVLVLEFGSGAREPMRMELPDFLRRFVKKLVLRHRPFRTEHALHDLEGFPAHLVGPFLNQLVQAGVLLQENA